MSVVLFTVLSDSLRKKWPAWILGTMVVLWLARLLTLGPMPLLDTTEARYAGMAQLMVLSGDWITPRMPDDLQPFLAKPPLTFWLVGQCLQWFGDHEWVYRLPAWLEGTALLGLTYAIGRQWFDRRSALLGALMLAATPFLWIESATVAMDTLVAVTVAMSLWAYRGIQLARKNDQSMRRFLMELALALAICLGLLNKGPVSIVLWLGPVVVWAMLSQSWRLLLIPNWFLVMGLGVAGATPWYLACQARNPDFFHYFFYQEHIGRYLLKDYGDRYGSAHHKPYGMSWFYAFLTAAPWTFWLPAAIVPGFQWIKNNLNPTFWPPATRFLLAWAVAAPIFFTPARSILATYLMVSMVPIALLLARWLSRTLHHLGKTNAPDACSPLPGWIRWTGLGTIVGGIGAYVYFGQVLPTLPDSGWLVPITGLMGLMVALYRLSQPMTPTRLLSFVLIFSLATGAVLSDAYGRLYRGISQARSQRETVAALRRIYPDTLHLLPVIFWGSRSFSWYVALRQPWVEALRHQGISPPKGFSAKPFIHDAPGKPLLAVVTPKKMVAFRQAYCLDGIQPVVSVSSVEVYDLKQLRPRTMMPTHQPGSCQPLP